MNPIDQMSNLIIENAIEIRLQKIETKARKVANSVDSFASKTLIGALIPEENYPFQECIILTKEIKCLSSAIRAEGNATYHWEERLDKMPLPIVWGPRRAYHPFSQESALKAPSFLEESPINAPSFSEEFALGDL